MRVVSLALGLVAAAVSIPLLALGAYGLWLFPGCLNDLGDLFPPLGRRLCMDSYLKTSLATVAAGLALLVLSLLGIIARRRFLRQRQQASA
jgi:hypothetical protein